MIAPLLPEPGGARGGGGITVRASTGFCGSCAQTPHRARTVCVAASILTSTPRATTASHRRAVRCGSNAGMISTSAPNPSHRRARLTKCAPEPVFRRSRQAYCWLVAAEPDEPRPNHPQQHGVASDDAAPGPGSLAILDRGRPGHRARPGARALPRTPRSLASTRRRHRRNGGPTATRLPAFNFLCPWTGPAPAVGARTCGTRLGSSSDRCHRPASHVDTDNAPGTTAGTAVGQRPQRPSWGRTPARRHPPGGRFV